MKTFEEWLATLPTAAIADPLNTALMRAGWEAAMAEVQVAWVKSAHREAA